MTENNEKQEAALRKLKISQHKSRPVADDYISRIFANITELHGDRYYGDDGAVFTALAAFNGQPVTVIAHKKGKNTKDNIKANWGMAHPEGYRKALRQMKLADKFSRPVFTFVDTPGAYGGQSAEERGQGEAIAKNLFEMSKLGVPVISVIITQGGSGGALGIALANRVLMLENANYSVISPRGFASLLWKDPSREYEAATKQKMTADDLLGFGVIDSIIAEPLEGAHKDIDLTAAAIKLSFEHHLKRLQAMSRGELIEDRYKKFRNMGFYSEA